MLLAVMTLPVMVACGGDDDDSTNNEHTALLASYQNTKTNIIGTWVMEGKYHNSSSSPSIKIGWNNNDEYGFFKLNPYYLLSFKSDGTLTDKDGETFAYSIVLDENDTAYDNSVEKGISAYWPYSKGVVKLVFDDAFVHKAIYKEVFVEIRTDGMLYFYDTTIPTKGIPIYRFKRQ